MPSQNSDAATDRPTRPPPLRENRCPSPTRSTEPVSWMRSTTIRTHIPIPKPTQRPARQSLRTHMPQAGTGADTAEPRVRHQGHVASKRQMLQSTGQLVGFSIPVPNGPAPISTRTSPVKSHPLDRRDGIAPPVNTRAGPSCRYTPSGSTTAGSMDVDLITDPSGARLPRGRSLCWSGPLAGARRRQDHVIRIHTIQRAQPLPEPRPPLAPFPEFQGHPRGVFHSPSAPPGPAGPGSVNAP